MIQNKKPTEAEALYAYLRGQPSEGQSELPIQEAETATALKAVAKEIEPDLAFQADLENQLHKAFRTSKPRNPGNLTRIAWAIAWAMLGVLFLSGMSWAIQNLIPRHIPLAIETENLVSPTISIPATQPGLATQSILEKTTQATSTSNPVAYNSPMLPGVEIVMQVELPESPPMATVYLQVPGEGIDIESARKVAARLGVSGSVYEMPGENPAAPLYVVTDGLSRVVFSNTINQFYFATDYVNVTSVINHRSPSPEEIANAETFLKEHDLLSFPYQAEISRINPGRISFLQLLEDRPVRYSLFDAAQISVQLNQQGEVANIDSNLLNFQEVGEYAIQSAQEAWERVLSSESPVGVEFTPMNLEPSDLQSWQRQYPLGQRIEIFDYFEELQPTSPGDSPLVLLNNYPVTGNLEKLLQTISPGTFMQVWGQFHKGEKGQHVLNIEGWQISNFPDQTIQGVIHRQGEQGFLLTSDNELLLPDLPESVSEGAQVTIRGVILEEAQLTLEWSWITTGAAGGGGGGGGPTFSELNLEATPGVPTVSTEPQEPLIQIGDRIDGAVGTLYIILRQYTDGSSRYEVNLQLEPGTAWSDGLAVRLEGPGLQGIETFNLLPIRVWGTFTDTSGWVPSISIQRFEPVYPDLTVQAWLGIVEYANLEGQKVLLFTCQDGKQFILGYSIDQDPDSIVGNIGDRIILEGIVIPGNAFGGFPVIDILDISLAQGRTDLKDYQLRSAAPQIIQESEPATMPGKITIEKVELVYHTSDLRHVIVSPEDPSPYVQPVWRFTGYYENGTPFEILVQALVDQYLK